MRKIKTLAVMLAFLSVNMFAAVGSAAPLTLVECRELVNKTSQNMAMLENFHMTLDFTISTLFRDQKINMAAIGECDIQAKPLRMKNAMTMTADFGAKVDKEEFVQYIEHAGDKFVSYTFADNQWVKQLLPYFDQYHEYDAYDESIKSVTPFEETDDLIIVDVIVDGDIWRKASERIAASGDMRSAKLMAGLFNDLGDITYRMTINKETDTVARIEMDLSDSIIKIIRNFTEPNQLPAADKAVVNGILDNTKVFMSIDISQLNQVPEIVIPQEAHDAREIPSVPVHKENACGDRQNS